MAAECQDCTEAVNTNYTLHTGTLTVCLESDGIVRDLGNVKGFEFVNSPEFLDHFRGSDGSLDAVIPLRRNYSFNATLEELTPSNMAMFTGGTPIANLPSGCKVPLAGVTGDCSPATGSVSFLHQFACGNKTIEIILWRAVIGSSESTLSLGEDILEIPITVRALPCDSLHPTEPFGVIIFSEECLAS